VNPVHSNWRVAQQAWRGAQEIEHECAGQTRMAHNAGLMGAARANQKPPKPQKPPIQAF
ncbi:hypothetical protein A2U01_0106527, partial [Trifolium medium]|nr:hypothetical protein [Trifolium medium]